MTYVLGMLFLAVVITMITGIRDHAKQPPHERRRHPRTTFL